ncbi:ribonuclease H-like domain-containing protein [Gymnopilus junonius]|uniref:Ribonuclease H-like domain-containing protein n=1 Tax=Gymnopilus junonius TaxID=109634 RepID=A0A9P5NZ32_GYMJU|nr:ribonuclease H-like domain-containing protein [Gymnopilus junonius]
MLGYIGLRRLCTRLPAHLHPLQVPPIHWLRQRPTVRTVMTTVPATLDFNAGPLVWIDCEMTGLDHKNDKIIEIAILITNGNLDLVDEGIEYIIHVDKEHLDGMGEWCTEQHRRSGLTKACMDSPHKLEFVSKQVLDYIKKWIPNEKTGVLAGSSVHVDKMFLHEQMPEVVDWLHYRIVDVSTVKEISRRWYLNKGAAPQNPEISHRALDDIKASIRELQWYRQNIFVPPKNNRRQSPSPTRQKSRRNSGSATP